MAENLTVTTLVENTVRRRRLLAEHGLSFLIETPDSRVLFDTGSGMTLYPNARELGVSLAGLDAVVCSHGHDDHTGGLASVLHNCRSAKVFAHPAALLPKFTRRGAETESIGMPENCAAAALAAGSCLTLSEGPVEVAPGVHATGQIPRGNDFEDTGGSFFLDSAATETDPITDDQALFIDAPAGVTVICGCAHSGVVNTLDYIAALTGATRIHTLIGGFHLGRASSERLDRTAQAFEQYGIQRLAPCHCTGAQASAFLRLHFPGRFVDLPAGAALSIQ